MMIDFILERDSTVDEKSYRTAAAVALTVDHLYRNFHLGKKACVAIAKALVAIYKERAAVIDRSRVGMADSGSIFTHCIYLYNRPNRRQSSTRNQWQRRHHILNLLSNASDETFNDTSILQSLLVQLRAMPTVANDGDLDCCLKIIIKKTYVKRDSEMHELIKCLRRLIRIEAGLGQSNFDISADNMPLKNHAVSMVLAGRKVWMLRPHVDNQKHNKVAYGDVSYGDESFDRDDEQNLVIDVVARTVRSHLYMLQRKGKLPNIPHHSNLEIVKVRLDKSIKVQQGHNRDVIHGRYGLFELKRTDYSREVIDILEGWYAENPSLPTDKQIGALIQHQRPVSFTAAKNWFKLRVALMSGRVRGYTMTGDLEKKLTKWYDKGEFTKQHKMDIGLQTGLTLSQVQNWYDTKNKKKKKEKKDNKL